MKTITFDYVKKDGSTSDRTLLALVTPGKNMYAGIDISDLDPVEGAEFIGRYEELHNKFLQEAKSLQAEFDLTHNYRQFIVEQMSNITEI